MWRHDDQAATLRRLFRRHPPQMHSLYVAGRDWAGLAERFMHRVVEAAGAALLADEATSSPTLPEARGAARPADLLLALKPNGARRRFDLALPHGWGYLNLKAAALAMPLLDEAQRQRLITVFSAHARRYDVVVVFGGGGSVADASWWLTAPPRHWLVAEVSGSGWRAALARARELVALGVDRLALVGAGEEPVETRRFLTHLQRAIVRTTSLPIWQTVAMSALASVWPTETGVAA
jgi:flagellar biosynthesis protein FlhG